MYNFIKKLLPVTLLLAGLFTTGCKKLLDIDSQDVVAEKNFWNNHEDTRAALIGTYGLMRAALADHDAHWMYGELRDGDFKSTQRQDLKSIINGDLRASYPLLNSLSNWRRFYAVVNAANMFLEHVGEVKARDPKYSDQNMHVDVAQIRFLRAFAYFYMVRIWGDVPLITTSHDGEFESKPRDSQQAVLAFVEKELNAAAADLPYQYSSNDPQQAGNYYNEDAGRWGGALARKLTAYAVLAHVAAWQGKYADASVYAQFVLDNYSKSGHSYVTTDNLCNSNGFFAGRIYNHMLAFNFLWAHTDASFSGHLEELTLAKPVVDKNLPDIYVPKDSILSIFNLPADERFSLDTLTGEPTSERYFANFSSHIPIFNKIKVIQGGGNSDPSFRIYGSAIVITRLEEIALLQAENLTVLGNSAKAIDLLNLIRDSRKIPHYDQAREGDLIDAIFRERRKELMGEGWRWYDLVRYNQIKQHNAAFMELIKKGGIYWPVSDDILNQNKQMTQNPYWQ
ncbi:RagB/SusD family nutrient uptake outer membrane protein [Compostibacter hankyongensis]|uniref:RagB/SusD family nutrient uptake outer membrane protein n=1 Tax=Compostibacter hankyongensis TaxID=1007089 RepID=A0ABP8G8Q9_9BACT